MRFISKFFLGLLALIQKKHAEREMDEELRGYLDAAVKDKMRSGMSQEEALRAARVEMGSVDAVKEEIRSVGWESTLETVWQEIRYVLRQFRRSPGFTAVAVVTLALGIGANTAIFSVLNALVLRPLPVYDPARLIAIYRLDKDGQWAGITVRQIEEIQRNQSAMKGVYGRVSPTNSYVEAQGAIWPVNVGYITGKYYSVLGVAPKLGRLISPDDVGLSTGTATPVAVLGYDFWQARYGGHRNVIGKDIEIGGKRFTIVGVTPKGFFGELVGFSVDITLPITERPDRPGWSQEKLSCQYAIGRLRDGVSIEQARAQLEAIWPAIRLETVPSTATAQEREKFISESARLAVETYPRNGFSFLRQRFAESLYVLVGLAALVLLVACANLASMLFARAGARQQEMAIRLALGAGRWRLLRQMVVESAMLSMCGAALGLIFANWASAWLVRFWAHIPFNPVTVLHAGLDFRVLIFTACAATFAVGLFGLAPAWHASGHAPAGAVQEGGRVSGRNFRRFGEILIAAQVAVSLVLVATGSLLVRSFEKLSTFDPGFQYRHVAFMQLIPKATTDGKIDENYCRKLARELSSLPGVSAVAFSHMLPGLGFGGSDKVAPAGTRPDRELEADFQIVSPAFFKTLDIPLLVGRNLRDQDDGHSPRVAIISKSLANQLFPSGQPLGKYVRVGTDAERQRVEVVGIAADARIRDIQTPWPYIVYVPYFQEPEYISHWTNVELLVARNPSDVLRESERTVASLGREYVLLSGPLGQSINTGLAAQRAAAYLAGFFAGITLLLAAIGLYGLIAYTVTQRTREIGVRMALGAQHRSVVSMVLREALLVVLAGLATGLPAAIAAGGFLRHMLFGLSPGDPTTVGGAILTMVCVTLLAAYLPARRATKIDPMVALRYE